MSVPDRKLLERPASSINGEHAVRPRRIRNLVRRTAYARNEEDQLLIVAAVDGEVGDDFGFDDATEDVAGGFDLREFVAGDFNSLRDFAGLERDVGADLAGNFDLQASDDTLLEAGFFHRDGIGADGKLRHGVGAIFAGGNRARKAGVHILNATAAPAIAAPLESVTVPRMVRGRSAHSLR